MSAVRPVSCETLIISLSVLKLWLMFDPWFSIKALKIEWSCMKTEPGNCACDGTGTDKGEQNEFEESGILGKTSGQFEDTEMGGGLLKKFSMVVVVF